MPATDINNTEVNSDMPAFTQDINTDSSGNWEFDFYNNLTPGEHTMVLIDDTGIQQETSFYVVKDSGSGLVNRVTTVLPLGYAYAAIIWIVLILGLILAYLNLARHTDKREGKNNHRHYARYGLIICTTALLVTLITGLMVNYRTKIFNNFFAQVYDKTNHVKVNVKGIVMDPFTKQGVLGVDLVSENTSIHTAAGGNFEFSGIDSYLDLQISHPKLNRLLVWRLTEDKIQNFNILFNVEMYNQLVSFIDVEAQEKKFDLYEMLPASVKATVLPDDFVKNYQSIFSRDDIGSQQIDIQSVDVVDKWTSDAYEVRFDMAVKCVIINNNKKADYYLVKEDDKWVVIR